MTSETVHLDGHIIDSQTLSKVLDLILLHGGDYEITHFRIGTTREEASHAEIVVRAPDAQALQHILQEVGQHGATSPAHEAAVGRRRPPTASSRRSSTRRRTSDVRPRGRALAAGRPHRDGLRRRARATAATAPRAICTPVHRVRTGDRVLVGDLAVKVVPAPRKDPAHVFGFMSSEVSAERPKELTVAAVARGMADMRARGLKILFVGGPGHHPHGRRRLPGTADRGGLDRRALRGQRARHARHRVGAARHVARRAADDGRADGERAQPPPARDQHASAPPAASARPSSRACSRAASCTPA